MSEGLCKDCRWLSLVRDGYDAWVSCHRPVAKALDIITGETTRPLERNPRRERRNSWFRDTCGPEGKYWEPKP